MTYIKNVKTLEELKKAYKKLALKLHPDCGGSDEEMAQLNNEYDDLFEKLKNTHKNKEGETYTKETNKDQSQELDKNVPEKNEVSVKMFQFAKSINRLLSGNQPQKKRNLDKLIKQTKAKENQSLQRNIPLR
ncbi:TPA: DnaJ domain-containing protein [Streptococcus suis]|nr:DnaJ domain-containing protein [Streptococcus suis]HEM3643159.1 DnaJ domain-containing protein [Streptococcus suis]